MAEYQMDGTMHPTGEAALWRELCKCHEENERLRELVRNSLAIINDLRGFREQKHYDAADNFQSQVLKELAK